MITMTESNPTTASRRFNWRRLFQFRLRTLLILTTIIAVLLGWWSHKARQQREAVAALNKAALICYDFEKKWGEQSQVPFWPAWLVDALGVDYFANVEAIGVFDKQITDDWLSHLKGVPLLQRLVLNNTQISDAGLEHLNGMTALQVLDLRNTQATDAGLKHLEGLTALQWLWLDNTQVTDAGLEHLKNLTTLQVLDLRNTQVTDAGLEHLKGLTTLQRLHLNNTQVTDAGMERLQKALPNCKIVQSTP